MGRRRGLDQPRRRRARDQPAHADRPATCTRIGRGLEQHRVDASADHRRLGRVRGGAHAQPRARALPRLPDPDDLLPATIDNNIPGTELSVGADSALNLIVDSIDRVRQAGTASRRCFVVETMGGRCGYLALMGGLSGGAVQVYLHEEGITLQDLAHDVERMVDELPGRAAAVRDGDEREGQPDVHQRVPVPAVRAGEPGPVRRPRGRARADPAGRHALAVRPHPRHPPRGALHGLAARPDRLRRRPAAR